MAKYSIEESTLKAIGDAIREKGGTTAGLDPEGEMPAAILALKGAEVEEVVNTAGGKSVYINAEAPKLPDGYMQVEYIESSGTQYVDTGFKPNQDTRVVMDAQLLSSSAAGFYFGARANGYVDSFAVLFSRSAVALRSAYGSQNLSFATTDYTKKVHIDKNKTSCQLGSETLTHTAATFQNTYNMYLFASNEFGSVGSKAKMKLWNCQIYDNGTLVRDYVPCKNASGTVGLYDMANGVFYGDAAGGAFVAGEIPKEVELPDGYTHIEYIQTNGDNWIDTGVYPSGTTRVVVDADLVGGDTYPTLFGAWTDGNSGKYIFLALSSASIRSYYGTTETEANVSIYGRHVVEQNKGNAYVDGEQYVSKSDSSFNTSQTLYLGTFHGSETSGSFGAVAKYYSAQIYQGSTIVRNFVPCKNASGVGGMYDTVNGVFYTAGGTGAFELGPLVMPGVSKVVLEDRVLVDLTSDTVTPEALLSGFTAHDAMGQLIQGAASAGRPVATGMFTPSSTTTSMVISGLDFKAKVVAVFKGSTGVTMGIVMDALVDTEIGIGFVDWAEYDYSYWLAVAKRTWSAATVKISTTTTGFTFSVPQTVPFGTQPYYWYAIG